MTAEATSREPVLRVKGLKQHFPITSGVLFKKQVGTVKAVDGIDLEVFPSETLGLVGESGCGKSTAATSPTWVARSSCRCAARRR